MSRDVYRFPIVFFTLETDCDQHEISIFCLIFEY